MNDSVDTYNMYAKYVALVELLFELFLINQYIILQSSARRITYSELKSMRKIADFFSLSYLDLMILLALSS